MLEKITEAERNMLKSNQQKHVISKFDKFAKELNETQVSFKTNISLEPLIEMHINAIREIRTQEVFLIKNYVAIFSRWEDKISAYIKVGNDDDDTIHKFPCWTERWRILTQAEE